VTPAHPRWARLAGAIVRRPVVAEPPRLASRWQISWPSRTRTQRLAAALLGVAIRSCGAGAGMSRGIPGLMMVGESLAALARQAIAAECVCLPRLFAERRLALENGRAAGPALISIWVLISASPSSGADNAQAWPTCQPIFGTQAAGKSVRPLREGRGGSNDQPDQIF
jgi:hypothetical protein